MWDCDKLDGDIRRKKKAIQRTNVPLCPGPTRQSCRSRGSLDFSAQSCAPDPRALATGDSLKQTAREGLQSVVFIVRQCFWCLSSWRVSLSPRSSGKTQNREKEMEQCAAEQKLARCQRLAHYEASVGVSILARRTDKSEVREEREEREKEKKEGAETLVRRRGGEKERQGEAFYDAVSEGREAIMKRCC